MLVTLVMPICFMRMRGLPRQARRLFDRNALKEWPFILWASYSFVCALAVSLPSFFIQLYGVRFVDADVAFDLLPVLNAGSFFGRLVIHLPPHLQIADLFADTARRYRYILRTKLDRSMSRLS